MKYLETKARDFFFYNMNMNAFKLLLLVCLAVSAAGQSSSSSSSYEDEETPATLAVLPLRITRQPQSQTALAGARVTFRCDYESAQNYDQTAAAIKIKWLFNLKPVDGAGSRQFVIGAYEPALHSGQYRCLVNNTLFSPPLVVLSEPATLSAATIEPVDVEKAPEESVQLGLSEGNVAIIACKLPVSNPPAVPVFYLNDVLLNASPIAYGGVSTTAASNDYNANRFKIFQSGNLQIANVRPSDSGVYRCSARNPVTNETRVIPRRTTLKVYEPIGTKLPEIVYVPLDTNRVRMGANLTLECVANGAPVPLVSWEKFGGVLPERRSQQVFGNLILTNVQPEDKGTYVCRAENGPGQATFKTALVDIFEAPTSVPTGETRTTVVARRDDTVELKCPIRARPRADIAWFYQGRQIVSTPSHRISTLGDKSVLTIRSFLPAASAGIYQCFGQNEYGTAQADLVLIPAQASSQTSDAAAAAESDVGGGKKPMIIIGPQNTTLYEGESVVLVCYTAETASGQIQINWLQNDLIIEPTLMRRFEINQLSGNLRIVSIQKSDAGVYKCIASNEHGVSSAEAVVTVRSNAAKNAQLDESKNPSAPSAASAAVASGRRTGSESRGRGSSAPPTASRPTVLQIGVDKILLKWTLVDGHTGKPVLDSASLNAVAYFKVDYRTSRPAGGLGHHHATWLTIDEKIDPKKREYILTDLSKQEAYSFRITTYLLSGEFAHGQKSLRFRLEPTWSPPSVLANAAAPAAPPVDFKLSQLQVQIAQIWAISASSLGLKWQTLAPGLVVNASTAFLLQKINGFYIYYRRLSGPETSADPAQQLPTPSNVPLFNFTRIKVPVGEPPASLVDTYVIANLEPSSQYEIKMTCYNLNGDLCSFSNTIFGLTTSAQPAATTTTNAAQASERPSAVNSSTPPAAATNVVFLAKSKQNEILFMILGVVLGVLVLLLVVFVVMCLVRQRQHKRLLAQLHNTSQKLTSSSCPTLIYEDSLRQGGNQSQLRSMQNAALLQAAAAAAASGNYAAKLIDPTLFANYTLNTQNLLMTGGAGSGSGNDSNSTNSQSMSTTTSSMTTPPALVSAQTNAEMAAAAAHHILLLNNANAASATLANLLQQQQQQNQSQPPPIPQVPPPTMGANGTLNRININLNPLNGFLDAHTSSFKNGQQSAATHQNQENFYHTLTTMGNLPGSEYNEPGQYSEYNNTTLNIRAHLLLKQQQQQQQILMNTLKAMNIKPQPLSASSPANEPHLPAGKSPSAMSMRRNNSVTSSKKSKKGGAKQQSSQQREQQQQQQQQAAELAAAAAAQSQAKNYYLLPNLAGANADLMALGAAPIGLFNANTLFLPQAQSHYQTTTGFMPHQQQQQQQFHLLNAENGAGANLPLMFMNLFDPNQLAHQQQQHHQHQQQQHAQQQHLAQNDANAIYESSLSDLDAAGASTAPAAKCEEEEEEPMLVSHYAASGLLLKENGGSGEDDESRRQRTKNHEELQVI